MHNWSLVCFTLSTQSAIGLIWLSVMGCWFGGGAQTDFSTWPLITVLTLAAMGGHGPKWLWSCLSLACFGSGEVLGRLRFYKAYRRFGL